VTASDDPHVTLARRLRDLRDESWPGKRITQSDLAVALSVSVPLISSWESQTNPKVPPENRLRAYATFFCTERSVARSPFKLISLTHLTEPEKARRQELVDELTALRRQALGDTASTDSAPNGLWRFPPEHTITIVCSELPDRLKQLMPYTAPDSPDHCEVYRYADLDALLELYGHIRAVNPTSQVNIRTSSELEPDDYTTHLVMLGGVDWNTVTADLLTRVELPVRQKTRVLESDISGFEVVSQSENRTYEPVLRKEETREVVVEDVAHFYRGPSPFNVKRTVTICNGMYGRGVLGAVRALTDVRFRDRNEAYVRQRFSERGPFSILFRVLVLNGKVMTPDWTQQRIRLHEWPSEAD
jgi:transcriptional regulator with XRE-family HTH domain